MKLWTGPWGPLLRWPLAATGATGVAGCLLCWLLAGGAGAVGAAIGATITMTFFTISVLVMAWTSRLAPHLVMGVALLTYGTKVTLLGIVLILLFDARWLSGMTLAITVITCTAVWLAAQMAAARQARISVFDPE